MPRFEARVVDEIFKTARKQMTISILKIMTFHFLLMALFFYPIMTLDVVSSIAAALVAQRVCSGLFNVYFLKYRINNAIQKYSRNDNTVTFTFNNGSTIDFAVDKVKLFFEIFSSGLNYKKMKCHWISAVFIVDKKSYFMLLDGLDGSKEEIKKEFSLYNKKKISKEMQENLDSLGYL